MKKEAFYKFVIGLLLTLNLVLIGFFLLRKSPHPPKHHFREQAFEILHLKGPQKYQFDNISKVHHKNMQLFHAEEKQLFQLYFQSASKDHLHQIQDIKKQKLEFTKAHFDSVKALLNDDQKMYFEEFREKALKRIMR